MKVSALSNKVSQKRIPTIVGLIILIIALIAGTIFIGAGPGVFAPRATPETTPSQVRISNVTDRSFTVSFLTDEATTGFVEYGTEPNSLDSQASDNRDQVSGSVGEYRLHYVTVRGIQPNTQYYFNIGTGSNTFDNNGAPFNITTAKRTGAPPAARTISGSVVTPNGAPAEGAIIYISSEGMEDMSSLVSSSGSWAVPLSDARTTGGDYAQIEDSAQIVIVAQGTTANLVSTLRTTVSEAHPFPAITLGSSEIQQATADEEETVDTVREAEATESAETDTTFQDLEADTASKSATDKLIDGKTALGSENEKAASESAKLVLELEKLDNENIENDEEKTVHTTKPTIKGKAAPSIPIRITVNSETQIETELVTDENGEFILDLSQFEDELEPGEHTVTINYADPETGEDVSRTWTFFVDVSENLVSQANAQESENQEDEPFGTSNPFPINSSTPTPTASASATPSATPATESGTATRTAKISTESSLIKSGSVGTTLALVFGGLFFITSGVWSFWISNQLEKAKK